MNSTFLQKLKIHKNWIPFITKEIDDLLVEIENHITKKDYTPDSEKVLRFLELPLKKAKVVIIGQDPYPQPGVATGRAFEVGTLHSWNEPFRNVSLKNILRTVYKAYTQKIIEYKQLKSKFDNEFPLFPPHKLFKHWESQGVLLLNTSFTCQLNHPGSHAKIWEAFTKKLLCFTNTELNGNATWFLWGNHAKMVATDLKIKKRIYSQHPMMCYPGTDRETDFLYGKTNCFKELIEEIDWTGYNLGPILKTSETLF
jgi:uracil-DNA glycosylase